MIMPYCPQCKSEFQDGFTSCSDCKIDLVPDLEEAILYVPFFQSDDKSITQKLKKFFLFSNVTSSIQYQPASETYILYITEDQLKEAKKLYQGFYYVEREAYEKSLLKQYMDTKATSSELDDDDSDKNDSLTENVNNTSKVDESVLEEAIYDVASDNENVVEQSADNVPIDNELVDEEPIDDEPIDESLILEEMPLYTDSWKKLKVEDLEDIEEEVATPPKSNTYVMKADQYKDYSSTVGVFLVLGFLGLIFVALNAFKVLTFLNGTFPIVTMGALFVAFVIIGISTLKKAEQIKEEAEIESKLTEEIIAWLKENVQNDFVDSMRDDSLTVELNYLHITEAIKEKVLAEFGDLEEAYTDTIIENYYNANFDE